MFLGKQVFSHYDFFFSCSLAELIDPGNATWQVLCYAAR